MLGGAVGAGARHAIGQHLAQRLTGFPWPTLIVNLSGGLLMGVLAGVYARQASPLDGLWLFLGVGVLGGFTTFSAFSLDAVTLIQRGAPGLAAAYVTASLLGAMTLFAGGLLIGKAA